MALRTRTVAALALLWLAGCGAKTGLLVPPVDALAVDALDATPRTDAPLDTSDTPPPPMRCSPRHVHTRVGTVVTLTPLADSVASTGYVFTLVSQPAGSRASLLTNGSPTAALTPDVAGEYDVDVSVPTAPPGDPLSCPITVVADPPDPICPGYQIDDPAIVAVPGGDMQVAYDVAWAAPRTAPGVILSDDASARVAAFVLERATHGAVTSPTTTLETEGTATEAALIRTFGAAPVLVGRTSATFEGLPLRRSTLRIATGAATTPDALRDRALTALSSLPTQPGAPAFAPAASFYIEIATVLRADTSQVVSIVAIAPTPSFDDTSTPTAIRLEDLTNATALARVGDTLGVRCQEITATRALEADFLWLVDTSASMDDKQERIGRSAQSFFAAMNNAGLDFRVGVMEAGNTTPQLSGRNGSGPFRWIAGSDPGGAQTMAFEVTSALFPGEPSGRPQQPFPVNDTQGFCPDDCHEEPMAEAVLAITEFERRRSVGETNPDFVLRDHAARVAFFVTDEPAGENDIDRFFALDRTRWGATPAALAANITSFFDTHDTTPFGLLPVATGVACPNVPNLDSCVTVAAGGAFVPIDIGNDREADAAFTSALSGVVDAVAGDASEFVLPVVPVSSTLRVRVGPRAAPRSRSNGFDYEDRSHALVFLGTTYRPAIGQQVKAAYFWWSP